MKKLIHIATMVIAILRCYNSRMVGALNILAILLLSFFSSDGEKSRHSLQQVVKDPSIRRLLLEGNFPEYHAAVDEAVSRHLHADLQERLSRNVGAGPESVRALISGNGRSDLVSLLGAVKGALMVATFVTELQTLGPAKAMGQAVQWLESGLIRRSGLRPEGFSSYFDLISDPSRARLGKPELEALDRDLGEAYRQVDVSYSSILSKLMEIL